MSGLKKMLDRNPALPFAMIHMAQLDAGETRSLIEAHANINFLISHANPLAVKLAAGAKPWTNMFENSRLFPEWRQLLIEHADRFIFALDNVFGAKHWKADVYLGQMALWWRALSDLPDDAANKIAHGNAERLWKLAPKPQNVAIRTPWDRKR